MLKTHPAPLVQCGREITPEEIEQIQETVETFCRLSRTELVKSICEHLEWFTATGECKTDACRKLLEKLETDGKIRLPAKRPMPSAKRRKTPVFSLHTNPRPELVGKLKDLDLVTLDVVRDKESQELWNEYVARYHYLGYKPPFGCNLRYFIRSDAGILGCVLFAGASKALRFRDRWIGWTPERRIQNLPWLINNARFLIFPWVHVRYLASHVLGRLYRSIRGDWLERWGYEPLLMETFVDSGRFQGVSYRAANWEYLGQTTGKGFVRQGKSYRTTPRMIFVKPLVKDFRRRLALEPLVGRVEP